ncbi:MAG: serine/threonine protein kinase [Pseudomonadales bacterium]|nr:serine/threonine protein kinase [Pseudomonadales bacterium]
MSAAPESIGRHQPCPGPLDEPTVVRDTDGSTVRVAPALPKILKQRFELGARLGGGMGTVFRARDRARILPGTGSAEVAIKLPDPVRLHATAAAAALHREARCLRLLEHPNIVRMVAFERDGPWPFIVMELVAGRDLGELLCDHPHGLPPGRAHRVILTLCAALSHTHGCGLVHADLKPGNVMVGVDDAVTLLDFGLAEAGPGTPPGLLDDDAPGPAWAAISPSYASPQRLAGEPACCADDLFALGIVVYLVLTGAHPFRGVPADRAARLGMRPAPPPGVTEGQWRALRSCLAFDARARPGSVCQVAQALAGAPPGAV